MCNLAACLGRAPFSLFLHVSIYRPRSCSLRLSYASAVNSEYSCLDDDYLELAYLTSSPSSNPDFCRPPSCSRLVSFEPGC